MRQLALLGGRPAFPDGLPIIQPAVPPLERVVARLRPSYDAGILTNGPLVRQLEEQAAERLGVPHAVAVSSCTSGLILTLRALTAPGRGVLPSFTFSASAHVLVWNNLVPRFVECDPRTFQIDVADAARHAEGAAVLLATHVFGSPCDAGGLEKVAADAGVPMVFDAAHAFGARYKGRPVGGAGDAEVFSLSPTKPVVAGEGGIVTTHNGSLAEEIRLGRDYGNPGDYNTLFAGLNARMSELHAALALESLVDMDENLALRQTVANRYREVLADVPGVVPQHVDPDHVSTYKDFTVAIDEEVFGLSRDMVARALTAEGIDTRRYFYPPVHRHAAYDSLPQIDLPVTDKVAKMVISLPMYPGLKPTNVETIVQVMGDLNVGAGELKDAF